MTISPLLLTQVEALNEDRALKLNRVKAVEGERENLEGAKAEAEDFLTKEFQICQKQKVSHMLARKDAVAAKERHEAQAEQLEGKLTEQREKLSTQAQQLDDFEAKYNEQHKEHGAIAKELTETKAEFAAYERKDVKFREDIKHTKEQEKKLKATVAKEQTKAKKAESDTAEYEALLETSEKEAAVLTETVEVEQAKVDEIYSGLQGETEAYRGASCPAYRQSPLRCRRLSHLSSTHTNCCWACIAMAGWWLHVTAAALAAKKEELAPFKQESDQCRSQVDILQVCINAHPLSSHQHKTSFFVCLGSPARFVLNHGSIGCHSRRPSMTLLSTPRMPAASS